MGPSVSHNNPNKTVATAPEGINALYISKRNLSLCTDHEAACIFCHTFTSFLAGDLSVRINAASIPESEMHVAPCQFQRSVYSTDVFTMDY